MRRVAKVSPGLPVTAAAAVAPPAGGMRSATEGYGPPEPGGHVHAERGGTARGRDDARGGVVVLLAALVVVPVGLLAGGEPAQFALAGLPAAPLLVLAVLASLAAGRPRLRLAADAWLLVVLLGIAGLSALIGAAAVLATPAPPAAVVPRLALLVGAALVSVAAAVGLTWPAVRRRAAAVVPIDPGALAHGLALAMLAVLTLAPLATLAVLGGRPPLLVLAAAATPAPGGSVLPLFYGLAWMLPAACVAAGFPVRRTFGGTLRRLGLVRPTIRQTAAAAGVAVALLAGATLLDGAVDRLWSATAWPRTDLAAFRGLLGGALSPPGAVAIGVTAGLGEEVAVRGLLQPRFGWLLPNLAFTAAHAYQYGPDALVAVFLLGSVLAAVRARSNTTVAAIAHGGYNTLAVLVTLLQLPGHW